MTKTLLLVALFAQACTTLHAELPMSRFESPESNGLAHRFGVQANLTRAHDFKVAPDASQRPPDFSNPTVSSDELVGFMGSFGLFDHFDLSVRTTASPSPIMGYAKLQLVGPTADEAKDGDSSLAVTFGAGGGGRSKSGDQNGLFGPGGNNWTATTSIETTDVALVIGHRIGERVLLFGSGFYTNYNILTKIDQEASTSSSSPAASFSQSTPAYASGGNLGLQFNMPNGATYIQVEGVYSTVHVANMSQSLLRAGASLGGSF